MRRTLSSAAAVALALLATPAATRAQTATQQVSLTFRVPFTLQRLYPDVTELYLSCGVSLTPTSPMFGSGKGPRVSVASLTKAADGSVSGETEVPVTVAVPVDAAGTTGSYRCQPYGCVNGACSQMYPGNSNTHLQVIAAAPPTASGTFTW